MSNWVGGLPPTPKSSKGEKKVMKGGRPQSPVADGGGHASRTFFGGAIPPTPPKMPKISAEDLKPPKVTFVGGPPAVPKAPPPPPPPPTPPPRPPPTPPPPPPPPPSPVSPRESEPSPPPSPPPPTLPTRLPSVFDKKLKKKRRKKRKRKPPPPKTPVYEEEEEEEPKFGVGTLPSIFAISHIPATRQEYPQDDGVYAKADATSPRSRDSDDEGPNISPEILSYKRGNPFAAIWGKQIDARNIIEVGPHGWHPTSNAPYDVTDDGETVTVGPSGWHESRSE